MSVESAAAGGTGDFDKGIGPMGPIYLLAGGAIKSREGDEGREECGLALARVWAKTWPEPGVALMPPVPQPQVA